MQDLKMAWREGDLDGIESNEAVVSLREQFPEVYQTLLLDRNRDWMKQLNTLFDDDAIEFVLVGAMHLVGDDGLIHQLKNSGFAIEQLN